MFRSLRVALVTAAVLVLPQCSEAGPIRWGFRAESPDGTVLREVRGMTDLFYSDFFLPDPQQNGELIPDPYPDNGLTSVIRRSRANVTVFDETSGQSGAFELYYDYVYQYEVYPDGVNPIYEGYTGGPWPDPIVLTLGGNTYAARGLGGELRVSVTPGEGPVTTPEPGTFALGALGLGVLGAVRRVRRPTAA